MKEFEKWWNKNRFGKNNTPGPKEVWKAALEWALEQENYDDYGNLILNRFIIETELEDET